MAYTTGQKTFWRCILKATNSWPFGLFIKGSKKILISGGLSFLKQLSGTRLTFFTSNETSYHRKIKTNLMVRTVYDLPAKKGANLWSKLAESGQANFKQKP